MNLWQRIAAWRRERGRTWMVSDDFGPEGIVFKTPLGDIQVPPVFRYDRFTAVWNTPHPEMWAASCLHDWICDQLGQHGHVLSTKGKVIITTRREGDALFYHAMLHATETILRKRLEFIGAIVEPAVKRRAIISDLRMCKRLARRAGWYLRGVRLWAVLTGR
jgi:hypothetical protein